MKKHLFLTGSDRAVLSAMLRSALGDRLAQAGGFIMQEEGACLSLLPAAGAGGVSGFETRPFLFRDRTPPVHDNEVLRADGVRLLNEAAWYPFAVLDAIGGFDLIIPQFRAALAELLNAELPLVGVVLSEREAEALRRELGLGEKLSLYTAQLHRALKQDPDTLLLDASGLGRLRAQKSLEQWVKEFT